MSGSRISPELIARSFGLVATVENSSVVLPLKAVECDFSVAADLVEVRMTQVFRQENPKPLDCDYLFPLPADASVYCCSADINGRIIRAQVKERGEAVKLAEQKKSEGRRVALVEAERENLFTLSLKNLQPDDLIMVTLKYIQPLRHLANRPSVEIPFCPGIRYIPGIPLIRSNRGNGIADDTDQVPDASRISPVRLDREHPDAAFIDIRGKIDGRFVDTASLLSPSHNIISSLEGDEVTVRLSDKGEVPDRDFVLRWAETKTEQLTARAWIQEVGGESYALMEVRAPKATGTPVPMDFYFLVDNSGSMAGVNWQKAALAVQTCVSKLAGGDRAMLTLFNTLPKDFAEQPLPPVQILTDANFQRLDRLQPEGGTELGNALRHVLELAAAHSKQRKKTLILITDAQVGNETAILKIVEESLDFPIHCFGIDIALNDALLLALARQQHGTFHSLNPADDVVKVISDLAETIRHPVLQDLSLSAGWESAVKFIPPLFSGQVFYLSARSAGQSSLALAARNGGKESVDISINVQAASNEAPYLHWCKNRIQSLIAERNGDEAIALSIQSNLICPLTAFIAWDEFEKVGIASHSLVQPVVKLFKRNLLSVQYRKMLQIALPKPEEVRMSVMASFCGSGGPGPKPEEVVSAIVEHLEANSQNQKPPPYPNPADRRLAFSSLFMLIRNRSRQRGLDTIWHEIEHWAFESDAHMLQRSSQVAVLIWELLPKADKCWSAHHQLFTQLMELEKKSGNSDGDSTRAMRVIGGRTRTETELVQLIEAEFHEQVDAQIIADYARIPNEIRQAVETFADKQFHTSLNSATQARVSQLRHGKFGNR